jgi:hypothetical protein
MTEFIRLTLPSRDEAGDGLATWVRKASIIQVGIDANYNTYLVIAGRPHPCCVEETAEDIVFALEGKE